MTHDDDVIGGNTEAEAQPSIERSAETEDHEVDVTTLETEVGVAAEVSR